MRGAPRDESSCCWRWPSRGGDATAYLARHKPVLNAEYTADHETTGGFCSADESAGIADALFSVDLDGGTYRPCRP